MYADFDGEMRKLSLALHNKGGVGASPRDEVGHGMSLAARVRQAAARYCSREEAIESLRYVYSAIGNYRLSGDLAELYTLHAYAPEGEPPDAAAIGRWLGDLQGQHGYFAAPRRTTERHRHYVNGRPQLPSPGGAPAALPNRQPHCVEVEQDVVCGFDVTVDVPLNYLLLRMSPGYASIGPAECYVVALLSRTHLRLFWGFSSFRYLDWVRTARVGTVDWTSEEALLRDRAAIDFVAGRVCQGFADFVEGQLRAEYGGATIAAAAAE